MVSLRPLTPAEYDTYLVRAIRNYADEGVRGGGWAAEEAQGQAAEAFRSLLSAGLDTPDHFLYAVMAGEGGPRLGTLWFALRGAGEHRHAFIYDIELDGAARGQGHGTATLRWLRDRAAGLGARSVQLHVFGHNGAARRLYERLGFRATNIHMRLDLIPQAASAPDPPAHRLP